MESKHFDISWTECAAGVCPKRPVAELYCKLKLINPAKDFTEYITMYFPRLCSVIDADFCSDWNPEEAEEGNGVVFWPCTKLEFDDIKVKLALVLERLYNILLEMNKAQETNTPQVKHDHLLLAVQAVRPVEKSYNKLVFVA